MRSKRAGDRLSLQERRHQAWLYPQRWYDPVDWFLAKKCHTRYGQIEFSRRETTSVDTLGGYIYSTGEAQSDTLHHTWYSVAVANYWAFHNEVYYCDWKSRIRNDEEWVWIESLPWDVPLVERRHDSPTSGWYGELAETANCYDPGPMWV